MFSLFRAVLVLLFCAVVPICGVAQETTITESAYYVVPSSSGRQKVIFAVIATNPFEDKFASNPSVRVTARAADGTIIRTEDFHSGGIRPRSIIAFCDSLIVDETPARVEIRPLNPRYEPTPFKAAQFLPFELSNVTSRAASGNNVRVTGEIKNPYSGETGAWITLLYRDDKGKLLGGHTAYESTIPAGEPTPFEFYVDLSEIPPNTKSIQRVAFSHNNFQTSWQKLLRAQ